MQRACLRYRQPSLCACMHALAPAPSLRGFGGVLGAEVKDLAGDARVHLQHILHGGLEVRGCIIPAHESCSACTPTTTRKPGAVDACMGAWAVCAWCHTSQAALTCSGAHAAHASKRSAPLGDEALVALAALQRLMHIADAHKLLLYGAQQRQACTTRASKPPSVTAKTTSRGMLAPGTRLH